MTENQSKKGREGKAERKPCQQQTKARRSPPLGHDIGQSRQGDGDPIHKPRAGIAYVVVIRAHFLDQLHKDETRGRQKT